MNAKLRQRSCGQSCAPHSTAAKGVKAVIRDEICLCASEVMVSLHHPKAFLIKVLHHHHCNEALQKGYVKLHGIKIHFIKWRSLKDAQGTILMFRVKLCLDGALQHAWMPDVVK
ncbi:hypothetical protein E2562_034760 [Oryza meyeriana var. granulata]|uniref:Uncharacterized protein n=1 Tax=Oryza meyeriana var. granulata TaxID=110450 RepID=A0A6G1CM73_9ORYZ|nr:hypothetical protein E2562_034760 [Oryza meyeriana var. granulata]